MSLLLKFLFNMYHSGNHTDEPKIRNSLLCVPSPKILCRQGGVSCENFFHEKQVTISLATG